MGASVIADTEFARIECICPNPVGQLAFWTFRHRAARVPLGGAGVPLQVQGLEHLPAGRPCVLVCNQASDLDGLVRVAALPVPLAFVAKRELGAQAIAGRLPPRRLSRRLDAGGG